MGVKIVVVALAVLVSAPQSDQLKAVADEFVRASRAEDGAAGPSFETVRRRAAAASAILGKLEAIDAATLSHDDWITHALLTFDAGLQRDAEKYFWLDFRVTPYSSPLGRGLTARLAALPVTTDAERLAYLDALHQIPAAVAAHEARLRSQVARGIVLPVDELTLVVPFLTSMIEDPASSAFAIPPAKLATVPEEKRDAFRQAVDDAVTTAVVPAVQRLAAFIDGPYRALAVKDAGIGQYPGGRDYYAHLIWRHTSLKLTPEEIHRIGLGEVARLERELDGARAAAGFNGSLAEFRRYLKTDPRFFAKNSDEFGERMMAATRRIEPHVPAYFSTMPKAPYGVLRLDPSLEASMTYGFYQLPSRLEPRGLYRFNGSNPGQKTTLMMAALIYHELVPGHHFQLGLRNESTQLTGYRRNVGYTSYIEGWAEYASDLAGDMGMYADPYDRAGRLAMDLFLSSRLVVDTGMNALGWTRQRAMDYMRDHTLEADVQINTETLRYSTDMPGQALAYKMGSLKIRELRRKAEAALGAAFDLKKFHEHVLEAGPMPISVLEQHVQCFIREMHPR
jgi:uncharacterized protein (DUF885 family)